MTWFNSTLEGAGLKRFGSGAILIVMLLSSVLFGLFAAGSLGIPAFGFFLALGFLAFHIETVSMVSAARRRRFARLWPEVIDSVHSAIASGLSLNEAFDDLAIEGPRELRIYFLELTSSLDNGATMESAIDYLKSEIGEVHADKFCEVIRIANASGSESLAASLAQQSKNLRNDLSLAGQLEAKQSWVIGTAKIAVTAPWIVVALLSARSENAAVYASPLGFQILLAGFVICAVAYRLVNSLGKMPSQPRIFLT